MSGLFEKNTDEIKRVAEALTVPQDFRDPFSFDISSGGQSLASFTADSPTSGSVSLTGFPEVKSGFESAQSQNTDALARLEGLLGSLASNQNAFIDARARPIEEAVTNRVADVDRSMAQRGVSGSLRNNEVNNAAFEGAQQVGDARALGTNEALNAQLAAEAARMGLGEEQLAIAQGQLEAELAEIMAGIDMVKAGLENQKQTSTQVGFGDAGGSTSPFEEGNALLSWLGQFLSD